MKYKYTNFFINSKRSFTTTLGNPTNLDFNFPMDLSDKTHYVEYIKMF